MEKTLERDIVGPGLNFLVPPFLLSFETFQSVTSLKGDGVRGGEEGDRSRLLERWLYRYHPCPSETSGSTKVYHVSVRRRTVSVGVFDSGSPVSADLSLVSVQKRDYKGSTHAHAHTPQDEPETTERRLDGCGVCTGRGPLPRYLPLPLSRPDRESQGVENLGGPWGEKIPLRTRGQLTSTIHPLRLVRSLAEEKDTRRKTIIKTGWDDGLTRPGGPVENEFEDLKEP